MKTSKKQTKTVKTAVFNNTKYSLDVISSLTPIGLTINNWMQRNIMLYNHPDDKDRVISVGIAFDDSMKVIADDEMDTWNLAIDYITRGKVYTRD